MGFRGRTLSATPSLPFISWEAQGRNAAPLLETVHSVVIAGQDAAAAAAFALGVARVHGSVRRVAIADLVGEVAPLQTLVTGDDAHGISDSFLYGVSLNKIAQPLEGSGNVFLMPSGTEPVATEMVYRNDRWRKLAAGFEQVGALLLVVAVPGTPGFDELCSYIGAVFPIGDLSVSLTSGARVIAIPRATPKEVERVAAKARAAGSEDPEARRTRLIAAAFAMIAIALLVGLMWPRILERLPDSIARYLPGYHATPGAGTITNSAPPAPDSARTRGDSGLVAMTRDSSVVRDTTAGTPSNDPGVTSNGAPQPAPAPPAALDVPVASTGTGGALVVANPQDSLRAAAYAVYVQAASTRNAAIPEGRVQNMPALAISPVLLGDASHWYRSTIGASDDAAGARALIDRLRAALVIGATSGSIVRVPYAFRLDQGLAPDAVSSALLGYQKRGISAYALQQNNGRVTLFTGAHESVVQAAVLADSLRRMGITPVLVYRTGRAF